MAKKRKSKSKKTFTKSRVNFIDTRDPLRSLLGLNSYPHFRLKEVQYGALSPYEKPKATKHRWLKPNNPPTPHISTKPVDLYKASKTVKVSTPDLSICGRRKQRKEVIHAFNHAGKAGQKPQVRNSTSNIQCKG